MSPDSIERRRRFGDEDVIHGPAAYYTDLGLMVLPLEARSKAPNGLLAPRGWHSATRNSAEVRHWPASANVGIACRASGLVVLDVDPCRGADDDLHDLERRLGELPETWSAITGNLGRHVYFADPGGSLVPKVPATEIEVKSRHYVVAPPSIHPETRRRYEWEFPPGEVKLAELPDAWHRLIVAPEDPARPEKVDRDDPLLEIPATAYIRLLTGRRPGHRGYVRCPFHGGGQERTPSLRPYGNNWACFACEPLSGRVALGGSIYEFAALVWGYALPLRGPAFLTVEARLLDVMLEAAAS